MQALVAEPWLSFWTGRRGALCRPPWGRNGCGVRLAELRSGRGCGWQGCMVFGWCTWRAARAYFYNYHLGETSKWSDNIKRTRYIVIKLNLILTQVSAKRSIIILSVELIKNKDWNSVSWYKLQLARFSKTCNGDRPELSLTRVLLRATC